MRNAIFLISISYCILIPSACIGQAKVTSNDKEYGDANVQLKSAKNESMKVLAKGSYSNVEKPFIYVATDESGVAELKSMSGKDSLGSEVDTDEHVVIGAFAGTQRTGGFAVSMKATEGKVSIDLNRPPKGAMVTQALTQPFQIVSIPRAFFRDANVIASRKWTKNAEELTNGVGSLEFSGGIAGIQTKYDLTGSITIFRYGSYVTLVLDLKGKDSEEQRVLRSMISLKTKGSRSTSGEIINGNLITSPHPAMKLELIESNQDVSISLIARDEKFPIKDGFQGSGKLTFRRSD